MKTKDLIFKKKRNDTGLGLEFRTDLRDDRELGAEISETQSRNVDAVDLDSARGGLIHTVQDSHKPDIFQVRVRD